jgi:hypothetical protein
VKLEYGAEFAANARQRKSKISVQCRTGTAVLFQSLSFLCVVRFRCRVDLCSLFHVFTAAESSV